jgi:hypothetical protein
MKPLTIVSTMYDFFLRQPDTLDAARHWIASEPDEDRRECYFAHQIGTAFEQIAERFTGNGENVETIADLLRIVVDICNWRLVARRLLRKATSPAAVYPRRHMRIIDVEGYRTDWN